MSDGGSFARLLNRLCTFKEFVLFLNMIREHKKSVQKVEKLNRTCTFKGKGIENYPWDINKK